MNDVLQMHYSADRHRKQTNALEGLSASNGFLRSGIRLSSPSRVPFRDKYPHLIEPAITDMLSFFSQQDQLDIILLDSLSGFVLRRM